MLDEEYKNLIDSWEVPPPAAAWDFIDKAIRKPWYAKPWGKVAIFSSTIIVSVIILYTATQDITTPPSVQTPNETKAEKAPVTLSSEDNTSTNNSKEPIKDGTGSSTEVSPADATLSRASTQPGTSTTKSTDNDKVTSVIPEVKTQKPAETNNTGVASVNTGEVSAANLKLSAHNICMGKMVTIKVSNAPTGSILDFGDNHQIVLTAGKSVIPYSYSLPGIYTIALKANATAVTSDEVQVDSKVQAYFKTNVLENTTIQFVNSSLAANKFIWIFDDGKMETVTGNNPLTHNYTSTSRKTYHVKLIALNTGTGCSDTFESEVKNPNFKNYFFTAIPNVFTPNNDGLNDVFEIPASEMKEWYLIILSENGQVVFETGKQQNYWNGKINNNGAECSKGTYRYMIKYRQAEDDEMHQKSGYITLLRE